MQKRDVYKRYPYDWIYTYIICMMILYCGRNGHRAAKTSRNHRYYNRYDERLREANKKKKKENRYCFRRTHNSKSSLPDT